jgi:apolipoprotein N-acyltransferase
MSAALPFVTLAVGAALMAAASRTASLPYAPWIALPCLLYVVRSLPAGLGLISLAAAISVALAVGLRGMIPAPNPIYFAILGPMVIGIVAPFAIDRLVAARWEHWLSTFLFPLAFVAVDFGNARLGPYATNGSIAYSQFDNLPLIQIAAVTGIFGVTFLLTWFASTVSWVILHGPQWSIVGTPIVVYGVTLALVLLAGDVRLANAASDRRSLRAAVISFPRDQFPPGEVTRLDEGRISDAERPQVRARLARLQDWFLDQTVREARAGARVVAWPEGNLIVLKEDEAAFVVRARQVAREEGIYLAMGIAAIEPGAVRPFGNKLTMIGPSGLQLFSYRKSRPVPGWEASIMVRGDGRLPLVATDEGRLGGSICFEMDHPDFVRQIGRAAADLWIVPANDWREVKRSHLQPVAFRAIENGTPILRATSAGMSGAFDANGRTLAVVDHFSNQRTMVAQIPVGAVSTVYARVGDLFAWLCIGALGVFMAMALLARA